MVRSETESVRLKLETKVLLIQDVDKVEEPGILDTLLGTRWQTENTGGYVIVKYR